MNERLKTELKRLRRRAAMGTWMGATARYTLLAGFCAGALALLLRSTFEISRGEAVWALLPIALAPLLAYVSSRRRWLSVDGSATWLDLRSGASGLILTDYELADERWAAKAVEALAQAPKLPAVDLRSVLLRSATGVGFALLAIWVYLPPAAALGPPALLYQNTLADLREKLETLTEEVELEEEQRHELEQRLEQLGVDAKLGENPEATFEAMDQLESRMQELAARAAEAAQRMSAALEVAPGAEANLEAQRAEMAEALAKLEQAGLAGKLDAALSAKLAQSVSGAELSALDVAALSELSLELSAVLAEQLGALAKAGLLKAGQAGKLGEAGDLSQFDEHVCDESCLTPGGL